MKYILLDFQILPRNVPRLTGYSSIVNYNNIDFLSISNQIIK